MDYKLSEADAALAAARRQATERLRRAGAFKTPAMQRRLRALVAETCIPPAHHAKLMHKRASTAALLSSARNTT